MNKIELLDVLKEFTEKTTADLILPVNFQKGDSNHEHRSAKVYKMRLPDSLSAQKKAPYILHQVITGKDIQSNGDRVKSRAMIRSIFCVYCDDEQEGALMLLNLMERLRIGLLKEVILGNQFMLDLEDGVEMLIYPDDTAPYYAGEMMTTWKIPPVEREVKNVYY